jgi:hypothetical protein
LLAEKLGTCPLSMGDVIRQGRLSVIRSPAMAGALDHMECGELVPDHIALALLGSGTAACAARRGTVSSSTGSLAPSLRPRNSTACYTRAR